jgi:hypothetical protein
MAYTNGKNDNNNFINFENSFGVYRPKAAMYVGVSYFSKGYQSNPVFVIQFAHVNEGSSGDNRTYDWKRENTYYFTAYNTIWEFAYRWRKWCQILGALKKNKVDNDEISAKYKSIADEQKFSNPKKRTMIYIMPGCYQGKYYLRVTFSGQITVSVTDAEANMIADYVENFLASYHQNCLIHRIMGMVYRASGPGLAPQNQLKNGYQSADELPSRRAGAVASAKPEVTGGASNEEFNDVDFATDESDFVANDEFTVEF